ncbi:MAG TPA: 50S ribosomal protein L21e [Candidatus Nanoarchaeia archaeon]|nr:50S ribosomal protein L21e [Candidatus Nanoarchaeia archaeon]
MVTRIGTKQRKTRHKFTLHYRQRGKLSLSQYFQEFKEGDRVNLKINSSVQTGQFFPRFHGMTGEITGKRGFCYEVKIHDQDKEKKLFVHPIHLKKQE